jgi:DNA polymerase-3 subunit gamma/tau
MGEEGEHCRAIIEGRHMDVIEMDAASRTGIGDIREIIESVRFLPVQARFKVYIIDEVHMLSNQAFNGLLKTLEEPPPHVKFIFATTEIRKVPVTVLSRCQRFDLKRIDAATLIDYLAKICGNENAEVEAGGLALIARAAEGSVRDGLSLLDQAIALGSGAPVSEAQVRDMLGLADRARIIDLFDMLMKGAIAEALAELEAQYNNGADPAVILSDLLEFTHWITRLKVAASASQDATATESDIARGEEMAGKLPLSSLTRTWQMLLKGLEEVRRAPQPISAAEMVLIRLAYASDLPAPDALVKKLLSQDGSSAGKAPTAPSRPTPASNGPTNGPPLQRDGGGAEPARQLAPEPAQASTETRASLKIPDFAAVIGLAEKYRDIDLKIQLEDYVHLVSFAPGRIDLRVDPQADRNLVQQLQARLHEWTGDKWFVSYSNDEGAPTIRQTKLDKAAKAQAEAEADPLVKEALEKFPGAKIVSITNQPIDAAPFNESDDTT